MEDTVISTPNPDQEKRISLPYAGHVGEMDSQTHTAMALEEQFFPLFEQAAVGFAKVGLQGEWLRVNQKLCDITGYTEAELLTMTFQEITHPDDLEADLSNMQKVLNNEMAINLLEKRYFRKDGSIVWIYLTATLVRDSAGCPLYFITVVEDISGRKLAEQALVASKEQLNLVIEGSNDGFWDVDLYTLGAYFSDRFYDILGLERKDNPTPSLNSGFWEIIHPDDREKVQRLAKTHLANSNDTFEIDIRIRHASGEYRHCFTRGKAVRDAVGKAYRMAGLITDITEKIQARQALEKALQRETLIRTIVEGMNQTFNVTEFLNFVAQAVGEHFQVDRCIIRCLEFDNSVQQYFYQLSAQYCANHTPPLSSETDQLTYSSMDISRLRNGQTSGRVLTASTPQDCLDFLLKYAKKYKISVENPPAVFQHFIQASQIQSVLGTEIAYKGLHYGSIELHQCLAQRQWLPEEIELIKTISTHLGTGLYQAEMFKKEQTAKEEAEMANRRKDQFLANMSHELRTPLNAVIGYSEMLKSQAPGALNEKQEHYVNNVITSGKHLLNLVNDVLDIARIVEGELTIYPEQVGLKLLLTEIENTLYEHARRKNVTLVFASNPEIHTIYADPFRLKQILFNLISNAIKFNRENGHVFVKYRWSRNKQWVVFDIVDTGIGIPKHEIPKLFGRFYQIDNTFSRREEGSGLGLNLTKKLVELHGGIISVTSNEGEGTTFTFRLPKRITSST